MKAGIDFFPLDVHLDDKWKLIEAQFGLRGFAIVVKLFQRIYGEQGYYCEWKEDIALLFGLSTGIENGNVVSDIINASIKRGIFDCKMFEKYGILTSTGIQKRYFDAAKRRKEITIVKEYTLFDVTVYLKDVNIIWKNVNTNGKNVYISQQSKEEKSKVKKSKGEYVSTDTAHSHFEKPTVDLIAQYCTARGNQIDPQKFFDYYESNGWKVGRNPMKDWKAAIRSWERNGFDDKSKNCATSEKKVLIGNRDMERRTYSPQEINGLFSDLKSEGDE